MSSYSQYIACHSYCLDNDTLSGCSNELGTKCCLVYSEGLCSSQCAANESIGENYTCIPQPEHTEELLKISSGSNNEETFIISTTSELEKSLFCTFWSFQVFIAESPFWNANNTMS